AHPGSLTATAVRGCAPWARPWCARRLDGAARLSWPGRGRRGAPRRYCGVVRVGGQCRGRDRALVLSRGRLLGPRWWTTLLAFGDLHGSFGLRHATEHPSEEQQEGHDERR